MTRGPEKFATLLPASIKRLDIQIRQEEILYDPSYCGSIVDSLVREKWRLASLGKVTIDEAGDIQCVCICEEDCFESSSDSWRSGLSQTTREDFGVMWKQCETVGIRLYYIKRMFDLEQSIFIMKPGDGLGEVVALEGPIPRSFVQEEQRES